MSKVLFAVAAAALGAAACDVNIHNGKASFDVASAEATDQWTHHHPIAADGRIEIVNVNGPISLTAGDAGGVDVHASITAKAMTDAGAKDILQQGKVQETVEQGRVRIETIPPRGVHGSYDVGYDVRVPAGAGVDVNATNGDVIVKDVPSRIKAAVVNGKFTLDGPVGPLDAVLLNGPMTVRAGGVAGPIRLELTNGRLTFELPTTAKANLSAQIVNGPLIVEGLDMPKPEGRRIRSTGLTLNGGGPDVTLRVTNGQLRVSGK